MLSLLAPAVNTRQDSAERAKKNGLQLYTVRKLSIIHTARGKSAMTAGGNCRPRLHVAERVSSGTGEKYGPHQTALQPQPILCIV